MAKTRGTSRQKRSSGRAAGKLRKTDGAPDLVPDPDGEEGRYVMRKIVFAVAVACIVAVALLVASEALKNNTAGGAPGIRIDAPRRYTVRLGAAPQASRTKVEEILGRDTIMELADGNELFTRELPGGRLALCAGKFDSADDPDARALLSRMKSLEVRGRRVFASARIWGYDPSEPE